MKGGAPGYFVDGTINLDLGITYDPNTHDLGYSLDNGGGGVIANADFNTPTGSGFDPFSYFADYYNQLRAQQQNSDPPPTALDYAQKLHDYFNNFPNGCSVGINGSVGANRASVGLDANTNKGINPFGQLSTPVAPFTSVRYNFGNNGETPRLSLRVGPPTGVAGTMGFTPSGKITSVGVNGQITVPGIGKAGATAYMGIGNFYQCK